MKIRYVEVILIVLTIESAAFAVLGYLDMTGDRNIESYIVVVIPSTIGAYTLVSDLYARKGR